MIRICFLSLLLATSTISVAQRTLKLRDVMLFCGNSKLAVSEDWNAIDAENLCIQEVTEKRHYKIYGQTRLLDVDYWTWKDERWGNGNARGYSYLRESNSGLATSVFFNTSEFVMLLENNTNMYFFIQYLVNF